MNMKENPANNLIQLNWNDDIRNESEDTYRNERTRGSRMRAFLAGWQDFLNNGSGYSGTPQPVTWDLLGMWCGEKYSNVQMEFRRGIYILYLRDYLDSPNCADWNDEDKENAIQVAVSEALRLHLARDSELNNERFYNL